MESQTINVPEPMEIPLPPINVPKPEETPLPPINVTELMEIPLPPINVPQPEEMPVPPINVPEPKETPLPLINVPEPKETPLPLKLVLCLANIRNGEAIGLGKPRKKTTRAPRPHDTIFCAHFLQLEVGEEIQSRICSLPMQEWSEISFLSVLGRVSNVILKSEPMAGGTVTHEGQFEVLKLSGTFVSGDDGSVKVRDNLRISLGDSNCNVIGGLLAGPLIASSSMQIVLGCSRDPAEEFQFNNLDWSSTKI